MFSHACVRGVRSPGMLPFRRLDFVSRTIQCATDPTRHARGPRPAAVRHRNPLRSVRSSSRVRSPVAEPRRGRCRAGLCRPPRRDRDPRRPLGGAAAAWIAAARFDASAGSVIVVPAATAPSPPRCSARHRRCRPAGRRALATALPAGRYRLASGFPDLQAAASPSPSGPTASTATVRPSPRCAALRAGGHRCGRARARRGRRLPHPRSRQYAG